MKATAQRSNQAGGRTGAGLQIGSRPATPWGAGSRAVLVWMVVACAAAFAAPAAAQSADSRLMRLSDEFIQRALTRHPQLATRVGIHEHDDLLYPVTQASMEEDAVWLRAFRTRLAALPRAELSF